MPEVPFELFADCVHAHAVGTLVVDHGFLILVHLYFTKVGLKSSNDLMEADDEDLEETGLTRFERKKLKRVLRSQDKNNDS